MNKIIYLLIILSLGFSFAQERSLNYKDERGVSCATIVVVDAEGTEIKLPPSVTKALDCGYASLSPNGDYLAYFQDDALNMYDFAEQGWIHFSDSPTHPDGINSSVFWSEDSSRLGLVHISQSFFESCCISTI